MASELSLTIAFSYTKNGITLSKSFSGNVTISGNYPIENTASIGTADETLALGDVSTPGWLYAKNLDSTNYITLGADGSSYFAKLKPGEPLLQRWNGAAIHAKANTAACDLEYLLLPD
jgi:hypothetical protein